MKKQTALFLVILLTAANSFALPAFNKEANASVAEKVEQSLTQQKAQQDEQTAPKTLKGTLLKGYFIDAFLKIKEFSGPNFKVLFFIDNRNDHNSGDIAFAITAAPDVLKRMEVNAFPEFKEGVNGDPDTEINITLTVKVMDPKTFERKITEIEEITTVTLKDLRDGNFTENPSTELVEGRVVPTKMTTETVKEHRSDCKDPYHCDCPEVTRQVIVPMQEVDVKVHNADCKDKYHCDCPTKKVFQ